MSSALTDNLACLLYSAGGCIIHRMLFWIDTDDLSLEVPGFMSNVFSVLMQSCALSLLAARWPPASGHFTAASTL